MKLSSLLDEDFILTQANVDTKEAAIGMLLERFSQHFQFGTTLKEVQQAVAAREALGQTVLEKGLAIPHARLESFNDFFVGIVIPATPIVENDQQINCVVVFLSSKTGSTIYLQTLSCFVALAKNDDLYNRFLKASTTEEVIQILDKQYVKDEVSVQNIMSTAVVSVTPQTTVKKLVDLFFEQNISYAPVLSDNGEIVGEINMNDLLHAGMPHYAIKIGNLNFLNHFQPFETLLTNENSILTESIMRKVSVTLSPDTSLFETALIMVKNNRRHLPVVEGKTLKGIVSQMDLLSKVLRF